MPCDTKVKAQQTVEQRQAEVRAAVERVSAALRAGTARLKIGPQGAVAVETTEDTDGVMDACMFRRVKKENTFEFRKALATAEASAGRKVNLVAIASGVHSHDGGKTWGQHD